VNESTVAEEWRKIEGSGGLYLVSSLGRVRSEPMNGNGGDGRVMRQKDSRGYRVVTIRLFGKRKCPSVHSLVAAAFIGRRPSGIQVNHKNGVKHDNRVENLEYASASENMRHSLYVLGNIASATCGSRNAMSKLTEADVQNIVEEYSSGKVFQADLAQRYGVSRPLISMLVRNRGWKHLTRPTVRISRWRR